MKVDFFDLLVAVPPHNMLAITQRNDWEKLTHNPLAQQFVALKSKKQKAKSIAQVMVYLVAPRTQLEPSHT